MRYLRYFDGKRIRRLALQGVYDAPQRKPRLSRTGSFVHMPAMAPMRAQSSGDLLVGSLIGETDRLKSRFTAFSESRTMVAPAEPGETTVIPTETVALDQPRKSDLQWLRSKYGLVTVDEGTHGKVLMRVPEDADDPIGLAAEAALALHERGGPATAHPNFLRVVQRTPLPSATSPTQWALDNAGQPGLIGADVGAPAAWTITRGREQIRVAILDEGTDTAHPFLKASVVAQADFVDRNATAMPDGDDAHGTACAGIVVSRDSTCSGLAPEVSLVAARIAKSDTQGGFWIFDDFATADAIDWCWDTARADVLSNSWGGGPPVPVISRAFERARTRGRGGKGTVVIAAAGNEQQPVSFPANLEGVIAVGASNQWDKRKTRSSEDGESWWGSNYGPGLDLMAPGVAIHTTDISGARGYSGSRTTEKFNGTSAATPFVAAAAGLMLSAAPALTEARVCEILRQTADPLAAPGKWNQYTGFGRLNAYSAVRAARRG